MMDNRELVHQLSVYPEYRTEFRNESFETRIQRCETLYRVYQPLPFSLRMYAKVYTAMQAAYSNYYEGWQKRVPGSGTSMSLVGVSGIGKSAAMSRILSCFPKTIRHSAYAGFPLPVVQIPYLLVQTPHNASVKSLCFAILAGIDRLLGTNYHEQTTRMRITLDGLIQRIVCITEAFHVGLLVLDEIQNIVYGKNNELMNFVVQLTNSTSISTCFVGTPQAIQPLKSQLRAARRTAGICLDRIEYGSEFHLLADALWKYQYTQTRCSMTEETRRLLYELTGGIPDILAKLLCLTQQRAISEGCERITHQTLRQTAVKELAIPLEVVRRSTEDAPSDAMLPADVSDIWEVVS